MSNEPVKVLLVEDDEDDYLLAHVIFSEIEGVRFNLRWSQTYESALQEIETFEPDVCMIDYRLGEHTGLDFIRECASRQLKVPMILLTGQGDREVDMEAMRAGAMDYLIKGQITPHLLERSIRYTVERYKTIDKLQEFAAIVESSDDAILGKTLDGIITSWNKGAEKIYGYTADEMIGESIYKIVPPDRRDEIAQILERLKEGETVEHLETVRVRKDGTPVDVSVTISPIKDSGGRIIGSSAIARDITERKHLEKQLRQSQKLEAVGQLAGGVAHDFNNLLTVITGYSDLAMKRLKMEDPLRHNVEEIKKAAERATSLTRQLLAFSRKQVLQPKVINLNSIIMDMEKMLCRLIGEHIELRTLPGTDLGQINADPGQIEQVILNLVINARDAMPKGGKISIETANTYLDEEYARRHIAVTPGWYAMLAVSDTGQGMDEETQRHIFEPFFTTKGEKGTGLGLSTVYGIVKQSGGNIWVYSEVGQGSTFKVYLPLVYEPAVTTEARTKVTSLKGTETILLVEDEEMVRDLARESLELEGYTVLEAANGGEALLIAQHYEGPIHLMLTDVVMPRMSGRELAEQLTELKPSMRVLFMSGYTDDAIVHHGRLQEGVPFIEKPFTPDSLARKVREVLDAPALS